MFDRFIYLTLDKIVSLCEKAKIYLQERKLLKECRQSWQVVIRNGKKNKRSKRKNIRKDPNTGVIRWRYVGESPDKFGWLIMAGYYESKNGKRTLMALSKIKQDKQIKVDITDYQDVADCIRSELKLPANHIAEYFNDKKFYKWYKKKYL